MDSATSTDERRALRAYTMPMGVFIAGLMLVSLLKRAGAGPWLETPEYWIYPIQTLACAAVLLRYRHGYELARPRRVLFTIAIAALVFVLWISPQAFLGLDPRIEGYNPEAFGNRPALYWTLLLFRFLRMVVIVPFVEEIFWRGFLLRYLINERFTKVPSGAFTWFSFTGVAIGFMLVHSTPDWPAALITGALYNFVAYRTKSLGACVLAHAITNLLLGLWIMQTRQWGFW